ncbi:MAG TPA: glycosyltransferase family 4 protein [Verrucomicrobiae bacterium]|nr:glycosyltransferase family 4 protein [Verrucomicrobiae bacterium]
MKILWLTWKDYTHPQAGGAEVVLRELSRRLVDDGHTVTFLTVRHPGASAHEMLDGIEVIRVGQNRYSHSIQALAYYLRHLRGKYDVVIEVVNTAPYFSVLFGGGAKTFLFYHQLAREVWFHETKSPIAEAGYYALEPIATRVLSRSKAPLITVSDSTLHDLSGYGFREERGHIITQGITIQPIPSLATAQKTKDPTILSLGALRAMKRTLDQIKAFELAKQHIRNLKFVIAGDASGEYGQRVLDYIAHSEFAADITYEGRVTDERKTELMRQAHMMCVTSVKEGWGLIVSEAASQGTPAIVYDVDGLRDSVHDRETGLVVPPYTLALANGINNLLEDQSFYQRVRKAAWEWSKRLTFDNSYQDFKQLLLEA